jgi:hypothetical protein
MNTNHRAFEGGAVFVVGFATLAAFFSGLGVYYLANPRGAIAALSTTNQHLGGIAIVVVDVVAWRYTAAVGMITLGVMCLLVLVDLRRNSTMLIPAVFFKGFDVVLLVRYSALHPRVPACLEFAFMDVVLVAAMIGLAVPARRRLVTSDRSSDTPSGDEGLTDRPGEKAMAR